MIVLAADIGGTKTHLALFEGEKCMREAQYRSQEFADFFAVLDEFKPGKIEASCLAVAGPVVERACRVTNLPWVIREEELSSRLGRVKLINDLEAVGWGLQSLKAEELLTLNEGKARGGNRAILAAGTGLGEAGLFFDGTGYHPFATEGGHADFPSRTERDWEFSKFLMRDGHPSLERALSGHGIVNLYRFLVEKGMPPLEEERADLITKRALAKDHKTAEEAVQWFLTLYGQEAGNLALKMMALGGVYVAGGIAPKIASLMKGSSFMRSFCDKGSFSSLMSEIPVQVILNESVGLLGALAYLKDHQIE